MSDNTPPGLALAEEILDRHAKLDELAPVSAKLYTRQDLAADKLRALLSLAELPRGYGWGEVLNGYFGGGVGPGDLIAIGAASAGAGKTAFVQQLFHGLALRSAQVAARESPGPLTPVLILSEMSPAALTRRALAWLTSEKASTFRAGRTAARPGKEHLVDAAYADADRLLASPGGLLYRLMAWQRQVSPRALLARLRAAGIEGGAGLVEQLRYLLREWGKVITFDQEVGQLPQCEIWPILVIDPLQRWASGARSEVDALNELAQALDSAADEDGFIAFVTSDTNKTSAKGDLAGDPLEKGAGLFRGSYQLIHNSDVAFYLGRPEGEPQDPTKIVPVQLIKNRYGPGYERALYSWTGATGHFRPLSAVEAERYEAEKKLTAVDGARDPMKRML
jgi:hypothetical protein